jgi:hypothetical protein
MPDAQRAHEILRPQPRQVLYLTEKLGVAGGKNKRNRNGATPQGERAFARIGA